MVEEAFKNSKTWFGKEKSREVLQEFYTPSIKFGKDESKDYPPTMKLNLKKTGATFDTKIYDVTGKKITGVPMEELLAKGTLVTALIEAADVWIAGTGKFNIRWNVTQLVVHKMADKGADFAFKGRGITPDNSSSSNSAAATVAEEEDNLVDDEEEAELTQAPATATATKTVTATTASSVVAAALEEDEDDDDGEAPPPPPKKAVTITKKKPVVAKKA